MSVSPVSIMYTPVAASDSPATLPAQPVTVRWRGIEPYDASFDAMRAFTDARTADTRDEIEHPPAYTLGQASDPAHLLVADSGIPLVKVDRGGQIYIGSTPDRRSRGNGVNQAGTISQAALRVVAIIG